MLGSYHTGLNTAREFTKLGRTEKRIAINVARKHWPPRNNNSRNVKSCSSHDHTRKDLVTAGKENHGVEVMGLNHHFYGIGDKLAACERISHSHMALT